MSAAEQHHLICLTIDVDPDGLSGAQVNRRTLTWNSLPQLASLPQVLTNQGLLSSYELPLTWFVRADGQLRTAFGSAAYLLSQYESFWARQVSLGHELGWHPHLYRQDGPLDEPELIVDAQAACAELRQLWKQIEHCWPSKVVAFRNGEGWHVADTFALVEAIGFTGDSTVIPGRYGGTGHPMDWRGAPNQPYFPDLLELKTCGKSRAMVELPMNTWLTQASYDSRPRLRYMNPAIHPRIFSASVELWKARYRNASGLFVWVFISHPDEIAQNGRPDLLYARSLEAYALNVACFAKAIANDHSRLEFLTVSQAAQRWRNWSATTNGDTQVC